MPTSVRLYWLCANMEWAHLPVAGGIYDQHPDLIKEWTIIFQMQNERDAAKQHQTLSRQEQMLANARKPGMKSER